MARWSIQLYAEYLTGYCAFLNLLGRLCVTTESTGGRTHWSGALAAG